MHRGALLVLLPAFLASRTAIAGLSVGAEVSLLRRTYDSLVESHAKSTLGFGVAARVGYDFDLARVHLIPELKLGFDRLPLFEATNILRPMAGMRAAIVVPYAVIVAFGHVGYTGASSGGRIAPEDGLIDFSGLTYDFGAGVDFTPLPVVDLGLWVGFSEVRSDHPYAWLSFGLQASLTF